MKLHDIVEAYVDYKHSLGMRYRSQAAVLRAFDRAMGEIPSEEVCRELKRNSVTAFIGPLLPELGNGIGATAQSTSPN
jgi:integrase/recombinase XerD